MQQVTSDILDVIALLERSQARPNSDSQDAAYTPDPWLQSIPVEPMPMHGEIDECTLMDPLDSIQDISVDNDPLRLSSCFYKKWQCSKSFELPCSKCQTHTRRRSFPDMCTAPPIIRFDSQCHLDSTSNSLVSLSPSIPTQQVVSPCNIPSVWQTPKSTKQWYQPNKKSFPALGVPSREQTPTLQTKRGAVMPVCSLIDSICRKNSCKLHDSPFHCSAQKVLPLPTTSCVSPSVKKARERKDVAEKSIRSLLLKITTPEQKVHFVTPLSVTPDTSASLNSMLPEPNAKDRETHIPMAAVWTTPTKDLPPQHDVSVLTHLYKSRHKDTFQQQLPAPWLTSTSPSQQCMMDQPFCSIHVLPNALDDGETSTLEIPGDVVIARLRGGCGDTDDGSDSEEESASSWNGESPHETGEFDPGEPMDKSRSLDEELLSDRDSEIISLDNQPLMSDPLPIKLIGSTYLTRPDERGQRFHAYVKSTITARHRPHSLVAHRAIEERKQGKMSYLVTYSHREREEEIVEYTEVLSYVKEQDVLSDDTQVWFVPRIIDHQGPLCKEDKYYRDSMYNVKIQWSDGAITCESLSAVLESHPRMCVAYADKYSLIEVHGWGDVKQYATDKRNIAWINCFQEQIDDFCVSLARYGIHLRDLYDDQPPLVGIPEYSRDNIKSLVYQRHIRNALDEGVIGFYHTFGKKDPLQRIELYFGHIGILPSADLFDDDSM